MTQQVYIIGRSYNAHGISDYLMKFDDVDGQPYFCGINGKIRTFSSFEEAQVAAIKCKEVCPVIMGGNPATYSSICACKRAA